jgi:hypothetical protein
VSGFRPATRTAARLRVGIAGPSGGGKTYTALRLAHLLGKRVAVLDTEHGSASLYAGEAPDGKPWAFDVLELDSFEATAYTNAIASAVAGGYDVLVIDSLSHAWSGIGGALDRVDAAAQRSGKGDSFGAWRTVTPQHNRMVETILAAPLHVIFTVRTKTEYVLEKGANGKTVPRKVGVAPVFRDGIEYEATVFLDIDVDHTMTVSKTRCVALDGMVATKPGPELARALLAWLAGGAPVAPPPPAAPVAPEPPVAPTKADTDSPAWRAWCAGLREATGQSYDVIAEWVEASGATRPSAWTASQRAGLLRALGEAGHPKRVALDAWLAARADAREPGEEG